MQAPTRASEEYEAQKRLSVATTLAVRDQWSRMSGDWSRSFASVGPRIAAVVTAGQVASARFGAAYVPEVLEEQGMFPRPVARVNARAFAGRAADGRDLLSLLGLSVVKSRQAGTLDGGRSFLDAVVETELEDAHRGAIQAATIARPRTGYVRMVNTPCCADCAVLAGKFFKSNEGFLRHPNCRCFHVPSTDPSSQYATYPDPSEVTGLSEGERKALGAGGDWSQVINARRGRSANKMSTTEGTTRRGMYGGGYSSAGRQQVTSVSAPRRQGAVANYRTRRTDPRMTPDGIYRVASDEDEARRLLARFGYLS